MISKLIIVELIFFFFFQIKQITFFVICKKKKHLNSFNCKTENTLCCSNNDNSICKLWIFEYKKIYIFSTFKMYKGMKKNKMKNKIFICDYIFM